MIIPTPKRRSVSLGTTSSSEEVNLPTSGINVLISGDPRSGKSWIAGLLSEQLIEEGYRVCIVDPEGDYAQMGERPNVIAFGPDLPLPSPSAAARLLGSERFSAVLTLSTLAPAEQRTYVAQLFDAVTEVRGSTGCPHWLVIDEAHYFFQAQSELVRYMGSTTGSVCLVTYRPSLLANEVYEVLGAHIITTTKVEDERYFLTKIFQAHAHIGISAHEALEALESPRAGLLLNNTAGALWRVFTPASRITRHGHHARKYADTRLPDEKAFRFVDAGGPLTAYNVKEFAEAIRQAPPASLRHHLRAGDFSRWVGEVIGDQQLARGLRKLERSTGPVANPNQAEILAHLEEHYAIERQPR